MYIVNPDGKKNDITPNISGMPYCRNFCTQNALFPFTDVIYALTPLRFLGQRYQSEWCLENRGCPDEIRAVLEPRDHIQPSVVHHMVDYYVRAGTMPPTP